MSAFGKKARWIDVSQVTNNVLARAAEISSVEKACAKLQQAMRITDGGLASQFFDWLSDGEWERAPAWKRAHALQEYVMYERVMSEIY